MSKADLHTNTQMRSFESDSSHFCSIMDLLCATCAWKPCSGMSRTMRSSTRAASHAHTIARTARCSSSSSREDTRVSTATTQGPNCVSCLQRPRDGITSFFPCSSSSSQGCQSIARRSVSVARVPQPQRHLAVASECSSPKCCHVRKSSHSTSAADEARRPVRTGAALCVREGASSSLRRPTRREGKIGALSRSRSDDWRFAVVDRPSKAKSVQIEGRSEGLVFGWSERLER